MKDPNSVFERPTSLTFQCNACHNNCDWPTTTKFDRENHLLKQVRKRKNVIWVNAADNQPIVTATEFNDSNTVTNPNPDNDNTRSIVENMNVSYRSGSKQQICTSVLETIFEMEQHETEIEETEHDVNDLVDDLDQDKKSYR
jgi:hypothetical protein